MNETEFDSKARERYRRRGIFGNPDTPKKVYLNELAHRLTPSIGDFALILFCGVLMSAAIWFNVPVLLVPVFAFFPFMGSFFGFLLGLTAGSFRFALKAFANLLILMALYFAGLFLIGTAAQRFNLSVSPFFGAFLQPSALLLFTCAVCVFFSVTRLVVWKERIPESFSTAAFASVWLPLGVAGFMFGTGYAEAATVALRTALMGFAVNLAVTLIALYLHRLFTAKPAAFVLSLTLLALSAGWVFLWRGPVLVSAGATITSIRARLNAESVELVPAGLPDSAAALVGPGTLPGGAAGATLQPADVDRESDSTAEVTARLTAVSTATATVSPFPTDAPATLAPPEKTADTTTYEMTRSSVQEKFGIKFPTGLGNGETPAPAASETSALSATVTKPATLTTAPSATATAEPSATATVTVTATSVPTATPVPPTRAFVPTITPTLTRTLRPTATATVTFTAAPPVNYAVVHVENDVGVLVRLSPEFNAVVMKSVLNGSLLELMGEEREMPFNAFTWVRVRTNDGYVGWVGKNTLIYPDGWTITPTAVSRLTPDPATEFPKAELAPAFPDASGTKPPVQSPDLMSSVAEGKYAIVQSQSEIGVLLRVSPERNADVMKSILNGSRIELTGRERTTEPGDYAWVQVRTEDGFVGWIGMEGLTFLNDPSELAAAVASARPTVALTLRQPLDKETTTTAIASGKYAVVQSQTEIGVLLRVSPDHQAQTMKSILNGNRVELTGEERPATARNVAWTQVRTEDGHVGWVPKEGLIFPDQAGALIVRALSPTPVPFLDNAGRTTAVASEKYAVVQSQTEIGVLLRVSPDRGAQVMKSILNGTRIELTGEERAETGRSVAWVQVRTEDGYIGWIAREGLVFSGGAVAVIPTVVPSPIVPSRPTVVPSPVVSSRPTVVPSPVVSLRPTVVPSPVVSSRPTVVPSPVVSSRPTVVPSPVVSSLPTTVPTVMQEPVVSEIPTAIPTFPATVEYAIVRNELDVGTLIREGPDWNSGVKMSVLNGDQVVLTGVERKSRSERTLWIQVRTVNGYVGWVPREVLRFANEAIPTLVPTRVPVAVFSGEPADYVIINASDQPGVYIRLDPTTSAAVRKAVLNGSLVELVRGAEEMTSEGLTWVKVKTVDGLVGWVGKETLIYPER